MPPQPAATNTLYVDYSGPMGSRTMQFRFGMDGNPTDAPGVVDPILDAITPLWPNEVSVVGMRWRAIGSTFSLPIASIPSYIGQHASPLAEVDYPRFVSLSGRGQSTGAEVRLFVYGLIVTTPSDYRISISDNAAIATLVTAWNLASQGGQLVTERGDSFVARTYANVGYNSYYERKARG